MYPWGNETPDCELANFGDCVGSTAPVGSYAEGASWVDAMDMAGNVWEWVADWYESDYYASSPANNPQGPDDGQYKVLRGGGWLFADGIRAAYRNLFAPASAFSDSGLRCAQE
ncbi:MAG: SUMF1/EgtB/PvdO family nonheme iron enzyme [Anaerolineales bacterium]|nr:SUMF1/EgtB/PvdO family nonheme iron enzyme [Anaerolineales bacterium]